MTELKCYTCIHYEDASRYDPSDDSELYALMKCNLHGHVTDWPYPCGDWEGVDE